MLIRETCHHGGDVYSHHVQLDFSASINPFRAPDPVRMAAAEAAHKSHIYPDPYCRELRRKLSETEGVPKDYILCGNGAAELIYSFAYSLPKEKPALIVSPTFCEYQSALYAAGVLSEYYQLDEGNAFQLDERILKMDFSRYGALILCTPNNPTGQTVRPDLLEKLAGTGIRMLCDMCFLDLTAAPERYDLPVLIGSFRNLLILKAFTKSFAIPGLRLGYALCSDPVFLLAMSQKAPCWNVSLPAQAAGYAALSCGKWLKESAMAISAERERMEKTLRDLGVKVYPGEANFLLLHSEADLYRLLLDRGILVRDCSDFAGLDKGYVRAAIRLPEENRCLLSAVEKILEMSPSPGLSQ